MQSNVFVGIKPGPKYQGGLHLLEEFGAGHQDGHHHHSHNRQQDLGTDKGTFLITSNCDYILLPLTNSRYRGVVNQVVADYEKGNSRYTGNLKIPAPKLQDICISPISKECHSIHRTAILLDRTRFGRSDQEGYVSSSPDTRM